MLALEQQQCHALCHIFSFLLCRIYFSATDQPFLVLYVLHVLSAPLQGMCMFTVWCLTLYSLSLYRSVDCSCLCFGQRHSQKTELARHKGTVLFNFYNLYQLRDNDPVPILHCIILLSQASFQYRNTDAVVHEYPIGPESDSESRPFISDTKYNSIDSSSNSNYRPKLA